MFLIFQRSGKSPKPMNRLNINDSMKVKNIILGSLSLTAALFLFTACGGGDSSSTEVERPAAHSMPMAEMTAPAAAGPIVITGNDQMRFAPTRFEVAAGSEVELVFHNIGTMPKAAMGHNLVILKQGTNATAFATASIAHQTTNYIAPDMMDSVLAYSAVLGPDERETLTFTAPTEPGDYPFVCSFPGHTPAGMVGVMVVK